MTESHPPEEELRGDTNALLFFYVKCNICSCFIIQKVLRIFYNY